MYKLKTQQSKRVFVRKRKPNFFIVGAAKSGTTSLASYLSQHPDIFVPGIKEPSYYIHDDGYDNWDEYLSLYEGRKEKVLCDASTGYLYEPSAPPRIKEHHPDAKIVIILRNPVDMAFSLWQFMQVAGSEMLPFIEAISDKQRSCRKTDKFLNECKKWRCNYLYLERAMYYTQVKRYIDVFGEGNISIHIFEEFFQHTNESLNKIISFLDLNKHDFDTRNPKNVGGQLRSRIIRDFVYNRQYPLLRKVFSPKTRERIRFLVRDLNKSKSRYKLNEMERKQLEEIFIKDINMLSTLIDMDLSLWNKDHIGIADCKS